MLVIIALKGRTRAKRTNQGYPIRYDGVIIIAAKIFCQNRSG
jgi:hypothetical protein